MAATTKRRAAPTKRKAPKRKAAKRRAPKRELSLRDEWRGLEVRRLRAAHAEALRDADRLRARLETAERRAEAADVRARVAETRASDRIARAETSPAKVEAVAHVRALARAELADQLYLELEAMTKREQDWRARAELAEARLAGLPVDADEPPPLAMCDVAGVN